MSSDKSPWYRIGYAIEQALGGGRPATPAERLSALVERLPGRDRGEARAPRGRPLADPLVAAGLGAVAARLLGVWAPRRRPGFTDLLRAGAAGAGVALLIEVVRPLLQGARPGTQIDRTTLSRVVHGAAQGLVYGSVVEPRLPGPGWAKGALYASAEYGLEGMGGLNRLVGARTPQGRFPGLVQVLDELTPPGRTYLEHLVFGVAVAALYGSSRSNSGIRDDGDGRSAESEGAGGAR